MLEQLIVLGQIPGTKIQLTFIQLLGMMVSIGCLLYAQRELRRIHTDN